MPALTRNHRAFGIKLTQTIRLLTAEFSFSLSESQWLHHSYLSEENFATQKSCHKLSYLSEIFSFITLYQEQILLYVLLCLRHRKGQAHNSCLSFSCLETSTTCLHYWRKHGPPAGTFRAFTWVQELYQLKSQSPWVPPCTESAYQEETQWDWRDTR